MVLYILYYITYVQYPYCGWGLSNRVFEEKSYLRRELRIKISMEEILCRHRFSYIILGIVLYTCVLSDLYIIISEG